MLRALALVSCLSGCGSIFDLEPVTRRADAGPDDGDGGTNGDAADSGLPCYGGNSGGFLSMCMDAPAIAVFSPTGLIDTDGAMCEVQQQTNGKDLCVIAAVSIVISTDVAVRGSRPLVLLATTNLSLTAVLRVNSTRTLLGRTGPGANATTCVAGNGTNHPSGGGGGAGGTHGTLGGIGGGGDNMGGMPGTPQDVGVLPTALRGGCPGGDGGNAPADSGGDGGGAVYLIAGNQLSLGPGTINASGMAGLGGDNAEGGGGGGSGGMIVLDAPMVAVSGNSILLAHGAGGGGGGDNLSPGGTGNEVNFSNPQYPSPGGIAGANFSGPGGDGSNTVTPNGMAGMTGATDAGGGGGGGGHGVIRVFSPDQAVSTSAVISPASQP